MGQIKERDSHRFKLAINAHQNFFHDRPVLSYERQSSEQLLRLLSGEIDECAVPPENGVIEGFPLADYRQQELSDVFIFSLCFYMKYCAVESQESIEFIRQQCLQFEKQQNIHPSLRSHLEPEDCAQLVWTQRHEKKFQLLFCQLKTYETELSEAVKKNDLSAIEKISLRIMQLSWTMLGLFVKSQSKAVIEKGGRNMAKYPAVGADTQDYLGYVGPHKAFWEETKGNAKFYGLPEVSTAVLR